MKNKNKNIVNVALDAEEQEILDSVERGEWKSVKNLKQEIDLQKLSQKIVCVAITALLK